MWHSYMANNLQYATKNTARMYGGAYFDKSFDDLMHPHVETQSAQEIVDDVAARAGLTII